MKRFEDELRRIHALCLQSFTGNFLYTPIAQAEFLEQYASVRSYLVPELILLAERGAELVGFLFVLPDWLRVQRRGTRDTLIVKTVAVRPGRQTAGLGALLVGRVHAAARELGYTRAIHALMHDANRSANISQRYGQVMRRYTLYARELA